MILLDAMDTKSFLSTPNRASERKVLLVEFNKGTEAKLEPKRRSPEKLPLLLKEFKKSSKSGSLVLGEALLMFHFTKLMWRFCAEDTITRCYLMNSPKELPGFWR